MLPSPSSRPHGAVGAFGSLPAPAFRRPIIPNSSALPSLGFLADSVSALDAGLSMATTGVALATTEVALVTGAVGAVGAGGAAHAASENGKARAKRDILGER